MNLPSKHDVARFAHFDDALDIALLRKANAVGWRARENGDEPYGCILADQNGNIVAEGECHVRRTGDPTRHGEMMMILEAIKNVGVDALGDCSAYVSGGPCVMCTGAIYWAGIGRLVYAIDIAAADNRDHTENGGKPTLRSHFKDILATGSRQMVVDGPYPELRDEILARFKGYDFSAD
ncbi:MAG: nucleoside deaminase [Aestuariivita sp.]|uniref:nucleoside deaminase n=1 Tax=Aestuariivita sp. TaxID=1872407 RepID=UPI003BAEDAA0